MISVNMDYCKFENTVLALEQCLEGWSDNVSISEAEARSRLRQLAQYIVEELDIEEEEL